MFKVFHKKVGTLRVSSGEIVLLRQLGVQCLLESSATAQQSEEGSKKGQSQCSANSTHTLPNTDLYLLLFSQFMGFHGSIFTDCNYEGDLLLFITLTLFHSFRNRLHCKLGFLPSILERRCFVINQNTKPDIHDPHLCCRRKNLP